MIQKLHIQNFKCLRNVEVEFGPLTILIGANDSGKTSILDALYLLSATTAQSLVGDLQNGNGTRYAVFSRTGPADDERLIGKLVWNRDRTQSIRWEVSGNIAEGQFRYGLSVPAGDFKFDEELEAPTDTNNIHNSVGGFWQSGSTFSTILEQKAHVFPGSPINSPETLAIAEALRTSGKYRFDPAHLRAVAELDVKPQLSPTGLGLAAVLDQLFNGPDSSVRLEVEKLIRQAIPSLQGIALANMGRYASVSEEGPSSLSAAIGKSIEFVLAGEQRPPVVIPSSLASDGAMLILAYSALAYGETPGTILIEEPENGLHSSMLKMILELLRGISTGLVGNRPRQVILTTHSPILLNFARPDEVRVVRRNRERATEVTPLEKAPGISSLLDEFGIGELWYLVGEEGILDGKKE